MLYLLYFIYLWFCVWSVLNVNIWYNDLFFSHHMHLRSSWRRWKMKLLRYVTIKEGNENICWQLTICYSSTIFSGSYIHRHSSIYILHSVIRLGMTFWSLLPLISFFSSYLPLIFVLIVSPFHMFILLLHRHAKNGSVKWRMKEKGESEGSEVEIWGMESGKNHINPYFCLFFSLFKWSNKGRVSHVLLICSWLFAYLF